jgi:hypothetical protein
MACDWTGLHPIKRLHKILTDNDIDVRTVSLGDRCPKREKSREIWVLFKGLVKDLRKMFADKVDFIPSAAPARVTQAVDGNLKPLLHIGQVKEEQEALCRRRELLEGGKDDLVTGNMSKVVR